MSAETVSSIKTVDLYIPLLNEGTEVLRPTKGLLLEAGLCQVLATPNYDPAIERWEFPPGAKVRCVLESRGNRNLLVARQLVQPSANWVEQVSGSLADLPEDDYQRFLDYCQAIRSGTAASDTQETPQ